MKLILTAFTAVALGGASSLTAQVTETRTERSVTESSDGSVSETSKTSVKTFTPEIRTKVERYFDPYKSSPHGLPPAYVQKIKVQEIPASWRTGRVEPGVVITEKERRYLVEAPPELIQVLPPPPEEVRYYLAGGNVVAVNKSYQVVDSVHVPTVKLVEPARTVEAVESVETVEAVEVAPVPAPPPPPPVQEVETVEETTVEVRR